MTPEERQKAFIAGGVLVAVGFGIAAFSGGDDSDNTGCALTAAGAGTLAVAMSRGGTADQILVAAGPIVAGAACKSAVKTIVQGGSASLTIESPEGQLQETVTLQDFTSPPPAEAPDFAPLGCLQWQTSLLYELCADGQIDPPPG